MKELENKTALVTGGSRGIGKAIALKLAENGANVVITYSSSADQAEEVVGKIESLGAKGLAIKADANDAENIVRAVRETVEKIGAIDILVNNAGVLDLVSITEATLENFDKTMNVNVKAVFAAAMEAAKNMPDGGRIITIGSVNGDFMPFPGGSLYAMSKAAVQMLTKGWARDLGAKKITANIVQPGPIDTQMNPADSDFAESLRGYTALGRYGKVEEVAELTLFLASPRANYITGATVNIDGGFTI